MQLLLVHPLSIFKFISLNTVDNRVNLVELTYKGARISRHCLIHMHLGKSLWTNNANHIL